MQLYIHKPQVVAGMTLKDSTLPEQNNMAFHTARDATTVVENRLRLAEQINQPLAHFVAAQQTHSDHVYRVTKEDRGRGAREEGSAILNTDALYTTEKNIVLSTFTADCVPVLFYHQAASIVGVIHSGWSGTVKEITKKTFQYMKEREEVAIEDFHVYIGSALSKKRFEVDRDVYELFHALGYADRFISYKASTNKYHIDNQQVVATQCERMGIPSSQIMIDRRCTFDSEVGFSYREDRQAGRHLSFIYQL